VITNGDNGKITFAKHMNVSYQNLENSFQMPMNTKNLMLCLYKISAVIGHHQPSSAIAGEGA
jgi:hypothetical protein